MGRGLVNHDDRSRNFRAVELIRGDTALTSKTWRRGGPYDQGQTPECVPNTGKGLLNSQNLSHSVPYRKRIKYDTHQFYIGAKENDEWAGEDYDGTSGLGLCRYLLSIGLIKSYHWTFGLDEALATLSHIGPLGIGIMWTEDMFEPDGDYYIHPTGAVAGGHEVEVNRIDVRNKYVEITNSWGREWGFHGTALMSWDDFGKVLANDGDSFVIMT